MTRNKRTMENEVEGYLTRQVEALGGRSVKIDTVIGFPDRLILLPQGVSALVETKRPTGGRVSDVQLVMHSLLRRMGHEPHVAYTQEDVDTLLRQLYPPRG